MRTQEGGEKMIQFIESITLFSENATRLAHFYRDKLGLAIATEAEIGENGENLFEIKLGKGSSFYIVDHSEVKGPNKEPQRMMINFEVKDIEKTAKKLKKAGVTNIADIYHVENYGSIATFKDVDGNFFQLVKTRE